MCRARPLLGTLVEIRAAGPEARLKPAIDAAFAVIKQVHEQMSFHDPESDVSRLNRQAARRPIRVAPETWAVLAFARLISEASDGAFDITVAPQLVRWGYLPRASAPQPSLEQNGYRRIQLLAGQKVRFLGPTLIDLGGIAKGYAVDRACAALEQHGVFDYVVNAGGDLRVGAQPETISVRHPGLPGVLVPLGAFRRASVATSATYFAGKRWRGKNVHPLVSPRTGAPAKLECSISVLAPDCLTGDALTKIVAVMGAKAGSVLRRFGAGAYLLSEQGKQRILGAAAFSEQAPS